MDGPFIYYQLLSSENEASMCAALKYVKTNSLRNWASLCMALLCMINYYPQKVGLNIRRPYICLNDPVL